MYKRILLKVSGEVLGGNGGGSNFDFENVKALASVLSVAAKKGVQIGIVVGAGNIFRGREIAHGEIDRVTADHMGMMATIINALALQSVLEKSGIEARVLSSIPMPEVMENYVHKRAINHLKNGRLVIFAGGTGRPYFTTDTAAVLRALEVHAEVVFKASDVDGVYDADPDTTPGAKRYDRLTYAEALEKRLSIMDASAFALAQENNLPIVVFKFSPENVGRVLGGERLGTVITG